jgi:hypothetical protein
MATVPGAPISLTCYLLIWDFFSDHIRLVSDDDVLGRGLDIISFVYILPWEGEWKEQEVAGGVESVADNCIRFGLMLIQRDVFEHWEYWFVSLWWKLSLLFSHSMLSSIHRRWSSDNLATQ